MLRQAERGVLMPLERDERPGLSLFVDPHLREDFPGRVESGGQDFDPGHQVKTIEQLVSQVVVGDPLGDRMGVILEVEPHQSRAPIGHAMIFGAADPRWEPSSAHQYDKVPNARVELLPGVGHLPMFEEPETCAASR